MVRVLYFCVPLPHVRYCAYRFDQPLDNCDELDAKSQNRNVTDMGSMFCNASSFNQPLNTSGNNWNVSKVTDMKCMFWNASSFNQPLNNWNVSYMTNMYSMFYDARSFNPYSDYAPWYYEESESE